MKLLKELEKDNRDKIFGLLLCAFSLLLIISLLSYDFDGDHSKIKAVFDGGDLGSIFSGLNNRGGVVGAVIAFGLYVFFGYFSFLIPTGLTAWGINRFFGKATIAIKKWSLISFGFVISLMTLVSLPSGKDSESILNIFFGGAIGHFTASILLTLFGSVFSYAFIFSLIITGLIVILPSLFKKTGGYVLGLITKYPKAAFTALKAKLNFKTKIKDEGSLGDESKNGFLTGLIRIKKKKKNKADIISEHNNSDVASEIEEALSDDEVGPSKVEKSASKKIKKVFNALAKQRWLSIPN